jgi:formylglycine-generating enzyme required for sulfatase activity
MRRLLQQSLIASVFCGLAALGWSCTLSVEPAVAEADKEPAPKDFKAYTDKIPAAPADNEAEVTFEMVPIQGGTFMMGSPETEKGRNKDEGPQHPVTVKSFWMGKVHVTWDEYDRFWKAHPGSKEDERNPDKKPKDPDAVSRPTPPYADETFGHGREGQPVLCITHHAAMQYCTWLSKVTGKTYRLPTEAEWEYAARAGTKTAYFFGDDPKDIGDYAWYVANSKDVAHPVAKKKSNPWGLYDIYGNVAEWCLDQYKEDYYASFPLDKPTLQPVLLPNEYRFSHVARGGSWADKPEQCRSASRRFSEPSWIKQDPQRPQSIWWLTDADFVGFRVVRAVEEQDNLKGLKSKVIKQSRNFPPKDK